jgi:hypothetical protein
VFLLRNKSNNDEFLSCETKTDEQGQEYKEAIGKDGTVYTIESEEPEPPKKNKGDISEFIRNSVIPFLPLNILSYQPNLCGSH